MDCVAAQGSCGCWLMINAWKDRHQSAGRRNRLLNNHMIEPWSSLFARKITHVFTKSKYILNNTSKTYNLNILRSYNANWTHFWHLHLSIGIFFVQIAFSYLLPIQTHCIPCTVYRKIGAHVFISSFWRLFSPSSPSSCLSAPSSSSCQLTFASLSTWPET